MDELTFAAGKLELESNLILAAPPCASTRLISSTRSGVRRMIMPKARGSLEAKLKVSSGKVGPAPPVPGPGPPLRLREAALPPMGRRAAPLGR